MIEGSTGLAQCRPFLAVRLGLEQLGADIASDLQRLGQRAALSYQAGDVVRCRQLHALRQPFNVQIDDPFHLGPTQALRGMHRDYAWIGGRADPIDQPPTPPPEVSGGDAVAAPA